MAHQIKHTFALDLERLFAYSIEQTFEQVLDFLSHTFRTLKTEPVHYQARRRQQVMTVRSNALLRVVVLLTVAVAALFLLLAGQVEAGDSVLLTQEHVVRSGETLWDIAGAHTADGADVRDTVAEIKAMNVLDGSVIFPGDRLVIPFIEG